MRVMVVNVGPVPRVIVLNNRKIFSRITSSINQWVMDFLQDYPPLSPITVTTTGNPYWVSYCGDKPCVVFPHRKNEEPSIYGIDALRQLHWFTKTPAFDGDEPNHKGITVAFKVHPVNRIPFTELELSFKTNGVYPVTQVNRGEKWDITLGTWNNELYYALRRTSFMKTIILLGTLTGHSVSIGKKFTIARLTIVPRIMIGAVSSFSRTTPCKITQPHLPHEVEYPTQGKTFCPGREGPAINIKTQTSHIDGLITTKFTIKLTQTTNNKHTLTK